MKKKFLYALNSFLHDKWSSPLIIVLLFSLVLFSISERLYSGENSMLIVIFLSVAALCLLVRWIYIIVKSLKSDSSEIECVAKKLNVKMKQTDGTLFLTYATFWAILWYLGNDNPIIGWATGILVIFFVIVAVVALVRSSE